ncbi:hypothetical protein niasHT_029783 [Heterodera trifolii]|uniref:Uncharacterized protein n=1 Tax=Heterodera trifolii TaxID=157864 RepID=A0ABD2KHP3_9BILA
MNEFCLFVQYKYNNNSVRYKTVHKDSENKQQFNEQKSGKQWKTDGQMDDGQMEENLWDKTIFFLKSAGGSSKSRPGQGSQEALSRHQQSRCSRTTADLW